ncbi:MarR family winged helix-turn-helix transcriptional regulator [Yinghuangia sp. ASG 101]|uniref:MarR family winged helix-turn-helix transcriptional regulator n=1 Tax=Yinghuangia sp. ASG 101 TaxID=2896848 RepID=UPI001E6578C5|nr:MarR family winged helix-turn-helix transcriptional regulator [Yinghuangia sp. ASG 101]UGQ10231.1 MarR family winged helix-turn-helix transcriptional regulator [Yinghuangia sp. ASG 101]
MDRRPPMGSRTGYRLVKVGEMLLALAEAELGRIGLKPKHVHVMESLLAYDGLSQQDVSRMLGIDPNVLVGVIDDLEARGFAERRRNPEDRRRHLVHVTDAGREAVETSRRILGDAEDAFFRVLTDDETAVLRTASDKLLTAHRAGWVPDKN